MHSCESERASKRGGRGWWWWWWGGYRNAKTKPVAYEGARKMADIAKWARAAAAESFVTTVPHANTCAHAHARTPVCTHGCTRMQVNSRNFDRFLSGKEPKSDKPKVLNTCSDR